MGVEAVRSRGSQNGATAAFGGAGRALCESSVSTLPPQVWETRTSFSLRLIDRTGIEGEFAFKVDYAIDDNPDSGSSLQVAVQEQLGLKLEAAKGPLEILVVDHAGKPSAN
jgi:uncharacterized protein (TIGR03435 family)